MHQGQPAPDPGTDHYACGKGLDLEFDYRDTEFFGRAMS